MTSNGRFVSHAENRLSALDSDVVPADLEMTIEQRITDGDDVVERYSVTLANGAATVSDGPADQPDVVITQDVETAAALRAGTAHAQGAFLTGRLSIDGDMDALLTNASALQAVLRALPGASTNGAADA